MKEGGIGYVFPILNDKVHKTPIQIANRIHKVLGHINRKLTKRIGQMAGLQNLTTYFRQRKFQQVRGRRLNRSLAPFLFIIIVTIRGKN